MYHDVSQPMPAPSGQVTGKKPVPHCPHRCFSWFTTYKGRFPAFLPLFFTCLHPASSFSLRTSTLSRRLFPHGCVFPLFNKLVPDGLMPHFLDFFHIPMCLQRPTSLNKLRNTGSSPHQHAKHRHPTLQSPALWQRPRHVLRPQHWHVHWRRCPPQVSLPRRRHSAIEARPRKRFPHQHELPRASGRPAPYPNQTRSHQAYGQLWKKWPDSDVPCGRTGAPG